MFAQFCACPVTIARHRQGPMLEERLAFLARLANQGYSRGGLRKQAYSLLVIADALALANRPRKTLTLAEVNPS